MPEASAASRASFPAIDSGARCPGCAKGVDPLRAGHVAIHDGVFLYYCDAGCKAAHLRTIARHLGDDVPTLDPPAVEARIRDARAAMGVGPEGANGSSAPPISHERETASEVERSRDAVPPEPLGEEAVEEASSEVAIAEPLASSPSQEELPASAPPFLVSPVSQGVLPLIDAPQTMRSPELRAEKVESRRAPRGTVAARAKRDRSVSGLPSRAAVSIAGGVAGVLVPLLSIADVGIGVRVALALFAAIALVVRAVLTTSDAADVPPLVAAAPVVGASCLAAACAVAGDPRAASLAVLSGLAASVALAVEEGIERAFRDVKEARARVERLLSAGARVVRGQAVVDALDVKAGEEVVIEAGDVVAVDGVLCAGEAVVVPWDGAPSEVTKSEGDAIVAGARVVSGRATVVTAWAGAERAWARGSSSRAGRPDVSAQAARLARGIAFRATPVAALVAGGAAYANGMASGWSGALAVACAACVALGTRAVVAAVALIHARAQMKALAHGVIYRDASAFDTAGRAAVAVVCSRGTVLTGIPEIVAVEAVIPGADAPRDASDSRILALAAGAETASTHPFANAILRAARTRGVRSENMRSATVHAGLGVTALSSAGERVIVGSRALLLQEKVSVAVVEARASELEAQGRSVLLVALAGKLVGLIALQDGLRAGARAAVQRLLDARIEPVLLSGESRETCETIARALDIDHVRPEVLPAERASEVRALTEGGQVVAALGHPSSDDGALGAADLAIAMGAAGRAAGEWGVVLASDDVRDAALALSVAHVARDRSRAVIAMGLAPGALAMIALVFAVGPLALAPLAMGASAALAMAIARQA